MKQYFLFILFLLLVSSNNFGQTFSDDFTGLTTATNLAGQSSWTKGGTGPDATVDNATPLTYEGYNGGGGEYVVMPVGVATSSRVFKLFTTPITSYTGTTVYFSFLLRLTATADSATAMGYFLTLGDAAGSTSALSPKLYARKNGTGFNIGVSKQTTTNWKIHWGTTVLNLNQTYLVVEKYVFHTAGIQPAVEGYDDECYLWVNPAITASEPNVNTAEIQHLGGGTLDPDFDGYQAIAGGIGSVIWNNRTITNPSGAFDGIRVANGATGTDAWTNLNPAAVPVEMTAFSANSINGNVELAWKTATEKNNNGFDVERKSANSDFVKIGFVKGNGTTTNFSSYSFTDKNINANSAYSYRLKQVDFDGTFFYSNVVNVSAGQTPSTFALGQNFPNPFNPSTSISYSVPLSGVVTLAIFNTLGQKVKEVVNQFQEAGNYTVSLNASDLSSGNYIYNISLNGQSINKKMLLLK
ncbi:MAG: T9SS type A sorting domain-containing protein [Ignavibacteria bacterium]|nr:T9SS type A sorting domain-containing protein [Ignavibacteria bacterium]